MNDITDIDNQLTNNRIRYYALFYSLKVWLSCAATAPLIYFVADWILRSTRPDLSMIGLYPIVVILEVIFSLATWLIFWGAIVVARRYLRDPRDQKLVISFLAVILTAGTFIALLGSDIELSMHSEPFDMALANCFCITIACWVFRIGPKVDQEQNLSNDELSQSS